jgi:hypothetical protein
MNWWGRCKTANVIFSRLPGAKAETEVEADGDADADGDDAAVTDEAA